MTATAGIRSQEETALWVKAYQGEVLGEAYFAAMAYGRLRELCDPEDRGVVNLVIAHELALETFMRRESAGLGDISLQAIAVLPHVKL